MNKILIFTFAMLISGFIYAGNTVNNGGDALPDDQVSVEELTKTINLARQHVFLFLNGVNRTYFQNFNKVFTTPTSIYDVIYNTEIEVQTSCVDQDGTLNDATSQGSTPNSICMSVERLQKKLGVDNYKRQIWALALHEFSHRIGFSETEATALQKESLKRLRTINDKVLPPGYVLESLRYYFADEELVLRYIRDRFIRMDIPEIVHITYVNLSPLVNGYADNTFFSEKETDQLRLQEIRMRNAFVTGICSIPDISEEGEKECRKRGITSSEIQRYRDLFVNSSVIDTKKFADEFGIKLYSAVNASAPMAFIQNYQDGKKEIDTIYNDVSFIKTRYEFLKDVLN